jgi:hypothetical protein
MAQGLESCRAAAGMNPEISDLSFALHDASNMEARFAKSS